MPLSPAPELDSLRKLRVYLEHSRHPGPGHGLSLPVPRFCKTSRGAGRLAHFLREALTFRRDGSVWPRGCCVWEATRQGGSRAGHLAHLQPRSGCTMASRLQPPTDSWRRGRQVRAPVAPWELLSSCRDPGPRTGRLPPASHAETVGWDWRPKAKGLHPSCPTPSVLSSPHLLEESGASDWERTVQPGNSRTAPWQHQRFLRGQRPNLPVQKEG